MAPHADDSTNSSVVSELSTPLTERSTQAAASAASAGSVPIAICGMALRLPGGVTSPTEFWQFLLDKTDARGPVPPNRYNADGFYSPSGRPGHIKSKHGYFLDESVDIGALDTTFFSLPGTAVERLDPQSRLLLQLAHECLESAGETTYRGKKVGCFIGNFAKDWQDRFIREPQATGMYKALGYCDFMLSNRISYEFDLKGPSMTIGTACSSSLVGLHEACRAIQKGDCDGALVGAANLITGPGLTIDLSEEGVLSPNASCRTFDADADGYARAEAVNMVYVKRLDSALRDGNPIRSILRGSSSNSDGKTAGITLPSREMQVALMRRAYEAAGIVSDDDIRQTAFVECHGTGTATGDPIETSSVATIFGGGDSSVYIGSVKPNVGHSEAASGITSLIKAVLALEHKTIPPNIKFDKPNPKIPFAEKNMHVPTDAVKWPLNRAERVSVNCFGVGGANAHAIVESRQSFLGPALARMALRNSIQSTQGRPTDSAKSNLLVFSATHAESLRRRIEDHHAYVRQNPESVSNVAHTLCCRRVHLPQRAFSIMSEKSQVLHVSPTAKVSGSSPKVAMVFTGQGAQYARMGAELMGTNATFAASFHQMAKALATLPDPPDWNLAEELLKPEGESRMPEPAIAQPLCTAVQAALVNVLADISIRPHVVIGHSSGEVAAAYAAGKLTLDDAIIAAYYRGVLAGMVTKVGTMAAVGMGWKETEPFLVPGVCIACENSPSSVTISGDDDKMDTVLEAIRSADPNTFARRLKVNRAYHSPHMKEIGAMYESKASTYAVSGRTSQTCLFFSTFTGKQLHAEDVIDGEYWKNNLENPVLFSTAIKALVDHHRGNSDGEGLFFLEIGPHSALGGPLRQTLAEVAYPSPYASCLDRKQDANQALLSALGNMFIENVPIDFAKLTNPHGDAEVLFDLPNYPWHHSQSLIFEPRMDKEWRLRKHPKHEILGSRVAESTNDEPAWRNMLSLKNVPWIRDHVVQGNVIFPCTGYLSMAGEAVRQLSDPEEYAGYSLRSVTISTALVLNETSSSEILMSLRRSRLTDSLESSWYDFVVSSYNGVSWVRHCYGQVRPLSAPPKELSLEAPGNLPRLVDIKSWYRAFDHVGGNHGPLFQGLQDITCSATEREASATGVNTYVDDEFHYPLHPTRFDCILQLFAVAGYRGLARNITSMNVPTFLGHVDVFSSPSEPIRMGVKADVSLRGTLRGTGVAVTNDGKAVLTIEGAQMGALEADSPNDNTNDPHAGARTVWRPHFDFVEATELVKPHPDQRDAVQKLESMHHLFVNETLRKLEGLQTATPHLQKFHSWLKTQSKLNLGSESLESVNRAVCQTVYEPFAQAMTRVLNNIVAIFKGEKEPLEVLLPDDTLTNLYNCLNLSDRSSLIQLVGHLKPNLRILEIGAGTGGTTSEFLKHLKSPLNGEPLFSQYTYTDISAGFFAAAKERFKDHVEDMVFKPLDISRDPAAQGFDLGAYDLVIAANVLHATPSLQQTLENVRVLLHPEGRLYLEELCCDVKAINYIMGLLPGWWLGENDGDRSSEPYVSPERWDMELRSAGFHGGVRSYALDAAKPHQMGANLISGHPIVPDKSTTENPVSPPVVILRDDDDATAAEIAKSLQAELGLIEHASISMQLPGADIDLESFIPRSSRVIACMDMSHPYLENVDSASFRRFQNLIKHASTHDVSILWLTKSCQLQSESPRWAQIIGTSRSIRSDLDINLVTCEISDADMCLRGTWALAASLFQLCHSEHRLSADNETISPDFEYVIYDQMIQVGRLYPACVSEELTSLRASRLDDSYSPAAKALQIGRYGRLGTLKWVTQRGSDRPLGGYEVELDTAAVGMNFKDVLIAMGVVDTEYPSLGIEAAGIVRSVGASVRHLVPGDRAFAFSGGCFSTLVRLHADLCVRIPEDMKLEEAATMPCVFSTAIYCLQDIGRLEEGQTVLIHSACGGVGLAAIQLCKMLGATIYATVGSQEKIEHLVAQHDIPRERIFNSRDTSFLDDVMRSTGGRGVDLVLNSLSGELLHASWKCVAEFGKMVEIGKRDLIGHGKLDLDVFELNRGYHGFDLGHMANHRPRIGRRLLETAVRYLKEGHIHPITPIKLFKAHQAEESFRYMQKGQHIGKIVVTMKDDEALGELEHSPSAPEPLQFDEGGSYLLVGGLGGLGGEILRWMVEKGARRIVILSRSAGQATKSSRYLFRDLESQCCSVQAVSGSVCVREDVDEAVRQAEQEGSTPLKGVMNLGMVLRDQNFANMSHQEWTEATGPKVQGTWNLHNACLEKRLDFFIMFSSISGIVGQRGQANYAGGNSFQDAFVQHRHKLGMPAGSVDICMMLDYGAVAENPQLMARLVAGGGYGIRVPELIECLETVIRSPSAEGKVNGAGKTAAWVQNSQLVLGLRSTVPLDSPENRLVWNNDRRMALYHNRSSGGAQSPTNTALSSSSSSSAKLAALLAEALAKPEILAEERTISNLGEIIARRLFELLLRPIEEGDSSIDLTQSLGDAGIDSLVAIEVRAWWRSALGLEISVLEMLAVPNLYGLGERAAKGLAAKMAV